MRKTMLPVKIFDIRSSHIQEVGQLLANDNSRRIMIALSESKDGLYLNEIVKKLGIRMSLVGYHINKLKELDFLTITVKPISRRTKDHNFYKISYPLFVVTFEKKVEVNE